MNHGISYIRIGRLKVYIFGIIFFIAIVNLLQMLLDIFKFPRGNKEFILMNQKISYDDDYIFDSGNKRSKYYHNINKINEGNINTNSANSFKNIHVSQTFVSSNDSELIAFSKKVFDLSDIYKNMDDYYYNLGNNIWCYKNGTIVDPTNKLTCQCKNGFYWDDCGLPSSVWDTIDRYPSSLLDIKRRNIPRRIINGIVFNHEFDMLEARLHDLNDSVDLFILLESSYSSLGEKKPLRFYEKFKRGFVNEFREKIVYVLLDKLPSSAQKNGWAMEFALRYYIGVLGLPRIKGLQNDDLFVLSDSDEIPTAEVINFLKFYEGYPEPVGFTLKWNVFGFFWQSVWDYQIPLSTKVNAAATIGVIRKVFLNNVYFIRRENTLRLKKLWKHILKYKSEGGQLAEWTIGSTEHYAGWHCSWCLRPDGIVVKMDSAQKNDTPRWGDFPEKRNINFIKTCIKEGRWFDEETKYLRSNIDEPMYAPPYFMKNINKFKHLLVPPES